MTSSIALRQSRGRQSHLPTIGGMLSLFVLCISIVFVTPTYAAHHFNKHKPPPQAPAPPPAPPAVPAPSAAPAPTCDKVALPAKARVAKTYLDAGSFDRAIPLLESSASESNLADGAPACIAQLLADALSVKDKSGVLSPANTSGDAACDRVSLPGKAHLAESYIDAGGYERALTLLEAAASESNLSDSELACIGRLTSKALAGREKAALSNATGSACDKVALPAKAQVAKTYLDAGSFDRAIPLLESSASESNLADGAPACIAQLLADALSVKDKSGVLSPANRSGDAACDRVSLPGKAHLAETYIDAGGYGRALTLLEAAASESNLSDSELACIGRLTSKALAGREKAALSNATGSACDKVALPEKARLARAALKSEDYERAATLLEAAEAEQDIPESALACISQLFADSIEGKERTTSFVSKFRDRFSQLLVENVPSILSVLLLFLLVWAAWAARKRMRNAEQITWKFRGFQDSTGLGLADDLAQALSGSARSDEDLQSAGLLNIPGLNLPRAPVDTAIQLEVKWSDVLSDGPTVQGVSSKWIGQLLDAVSAVFASHSPTISGWAKAEGDKVRIRLTALQEGHGLRTVFAESASASRDDLTIAIEEAATSMNYLLAEPLGGRTVADTIQLRKGVAELSKYIRDQDFEPLNDAVATFEQVRRASPEDLDAALYEGLARELREEHERAFALFDDVRRLATDPMMKSRAAYNAAVSQLRRYNREALGAAEAILRAVVADASTPSAISLFASATLANTIAHKPIFWMEYAGPMPPAGGQALADWRQAARKRMRAWLQEVGRLLDPLDRNAARISLSAKEENQLSWLAENARGNMIFNRAFSYLAAPESGMAVTPGQLDRAYNAAEQHYRRCEELLPAGVEVYTNLAAVLLKRHQYEGAIENAQKARALNPRYEYAYYREAQAIRLSAGDDACHTFLATEGQTLEKIKIPEFRTLFAQVAAHMPGT
jgi:tetratricopeptide (TPR) repeat protein